MGNKFRKIICAKCRNIIGYEGKKKFDQKKCLYRFKTCKKCLFTAMDQREITRDKEIVAPINEEVEKEMRKYLWDLNNS